MHKEFKHNNNTKVKYGCEKLLQWEKSRFHKLIAQNKKLGEGKLFLRVHWAGIKI